MKKYIILSVLMSCFTLFQVQAQEEVQAHTEDVVLTADKAAAADENIEKSVCAHSGKVSYYKKSVCPMSGKVSKEAVEWDKAEAKFVSIKESSSHSHDGAKKASCGEKAAKKSCSKKCSKKCSKSKKASSASAMTKEAKEDVKVLESSSL